MLESEKINLVLADSQFLVTEALKAIFADHEKYALVEVTNSFYQLNKILECNKTDVLITDFSLMDYDSVQDLQTIKLQYPKIAIVILTNALNRIEFMELSKAGIKNIITKITDREELFEAIEAASKGKKYYSTEILDLLIELHDKKNVVNEPNQLTASETEIVKLISEGLTSKAIADRKNISFYTVMTHRKNIFRKLGIKNSSELLMYAMKSGIIDTLEYYI